LSDILLDSGLQLWCTPFFFLYVRVFWFWHASMDFLNRVPSLAVVARIALAVFSLYHLLLGVGIVFAWKNGGQNAGKAASMNGAHCISVNRFLTHHVENSHSFSCSHHGPGSTSHHESGVIEMNRARTRFAFEIFGQRTSQDHFPHNKHSP
jgi:hypothetical protein